MFLSSLFFNWKLVEAESRILKTTFRLNKGSDNFQNLPGVRGHFVRRFLGDIQITDVLLDIAPLKNFLGTSKNDSLATVTAYHNYALPKDNLKNKFSLQKMFCSEIKGNVTRQLKFTWICRAWAKNGIFLRVRPLNPWLFLQQGTRNTNRIIDGLSERGTTRSLHIWSKNEKLAPAI